MRARRAIDRQSRRISFHQHHHLALPSGKESCIKTAPRGLVFGGGGVMGLVVDLHGEPLLKLFADAFSAMRPCLLGADLMIVRERV